MENTADKQIRAARILFNLAHCYLQTTDIDDEQEDKYKEDEKNNTKKKDFQQTEKEEVNGKEDDTFHKKQEKQNELDDEIELHLQVQVESKYQQQLCKDIQNKDLKKEKPEIEIELKIEIPQEFDGSYLKNADKEKQHFEEEVEKKSKKNHEFNQKRGRENIPELINLEINPDLKFQQDMEREIRLKHNIPKENVLVDLSGKNINPSSTQDQIQKGIDIKSQKDNSDVLLENELLEQKNIHENLMESFHRSVQKRIERLICEIPLEKQIINDDLRQEIKELKKEIKELDPENFNELNKDILEEVSKKDYLPVQVKFFKNLYRSFIQDSAPFYNRLDQLSNDKTQTAEQQKLNEEFLKKLDSLLLQKCNKETQEGVSGDERNQNQCEGIDGKEKFQHYDLVLQYNHEMSQELEGHAQQVVGKKILVDFYDDAVKTYLHKSDKDVLKEKLRRAGTDVIDQTQKEESKNIIFQLEFYKNVEVEEGLQKKNEKKLQNNTEEEINDDLIVKTQENEIEIEEDSDLEIENFKEEKQVYSEIANYENVEVNENEKFNNDELERAKIVESGVNTEDSEKMVQEDSDVDIEGFEGEVLEFPEVNIEDFEEESQENTDSDTEDLSEEEVIDINEVVEIVEDIEVESNCSIDNYTPSNDVPTPTCNELNLKINPNSNLTRDEEEKLKTINSSDPAIFTNHIKEKQTFFEFEHRLDELSQEYKGYVQQKVLKELEQDIDDKQLQEMEIFPDTLNEVNVNIKEDFKKEIEELQTEWCQLKPEFMNNVPLNFEKKNSNKKLKEKPFNLFDKLHSIHRKLLCKFADSKEWPENCFHPSSLLDVLFDDPTEFKPNVLVVTLHSEDKGYSIKIKTDKNSKSPEEYFFNYYEDTILVHMEDEHLPPDLLDLLDSAEPRLFYSGCVIAEIHDQVDEVPGRVYRLILRPFSLSIQRDIDRIIAKNSHVTDINYWSYNKRLKLESILLKKSYPVMCMDSSPIAGLVVNLQHQVLSCRTIVLNPLKRKNNCSEPKPSKTDSFNESNDNLNTSVLSNEPQEDSSKLMDTENTNIENYVLWKFEFRIKLLKLFKMFVIYITETQEFSMLLCTNPKIDSIKRIRFKIQPLEKKLNAYINKMLEILREKISPDIEVVQRYKCQYNSAPLSFKSIPSLLSDKMYKANNADISQLINIFISNSNIKYLPINKKLEEMYTHNGEITKHGTEKSDLSLMQEKLAADSQKTNETEENSSDPEIKRNMLFCATKKLSTNPKKFLDVLNDVDLVDKIPDSSSLKTRTIPKDILFNKDTSLEPSLILDLSKMDFKDEIADLSSLKPQTMSKNILFNDDTMPVLKEKSTNIETNSSLEPLLKRPIHIVLENDSSSDLVQEKILSVSSGSTIPVLRFLTTTTPFESSPAVVLSSLSIINSLVTSIKTYMLPIESPSLGYIAISESLSLQTEDNVLTSRFNDDDDSNTKSLPAMQPNELIHLTKIDDIAVKMFYYTNQITPTTCNEMSPTENIFTMFSKSECVEDREVLEDQYMLRCLQLFHQQPTLLGISTPHNTQENEDEFPDNM